MSADPLDSVLQHLAVSGSVFSRAQLAAPWGVHTRAMPHAIFHVIVRGAGWAATRTDDGDPRGPPVAWRAGDLLLFPHGTGHALTDTPGAPTRSITTLAGAPGSDGLPCIHAAGTGAETRILCGTLRFDTWAADMLLPHLPPLVHVPADGGPAAAWMDATLRMLGAEVEGGRPGSDAVVGRLAEILFIQAVRSWAQCGGAARGWLAALPDPSLAAALAAMHDQPAEPWTVATLARAAGMSRSAFSARFTDAVGVPPGTHLTRWRLLLARRALATTAAPIGDIAEQVGYRSEAAFSRAFKRAMGRSPREWRRQAA